MILTTTTTTAGGGINTTTTTTTTTAKKKSSQGRKKIEIKRIEEVNNRQVTFSKRRAGLFKKASELCILTGAHIAILVNSPGGRVFAFGHPSADALIDRYLSNKTTTTTTIEASSSSSSSHQKAPLMLKEYNQHYVEVSKELEAEKKRKEAIQESKIKANNVGGGGGLGLAWYDEPVDEMETEELQQYFNSLGELRRKVVVRADELMMIKKAPALLGPNMLDMGHPTHAPNFDMVPGPANVMGQVGFNYGGLPPPPMDYQQPR